MWDSLFDLVSALLWDPVAKRPRFALFLWILVAVATFALLVMYVLLR